MIDRYRIGQLRDVEVFRLVSQGTLEEIVYARQIYKQQQANIGYNATSERRYFQGVQDRKDQKGEIFGLTNLFAFQGESVVLRDIVNKTNVAESRAGLRVASLELDEDDEDVENDSADESKHDVDFKIEPDNEDAAMSQLAAMIRDDGVLPKKKKSQTAGAARKHDPVQAILASVGVQYTHENSEVIGSSKVEVQLSKRAEEVTEDGETQQQEARVFFEESQSQAQANEIAGVHVDGGIRYRYRPPEEVKRRQFCSMAKWAGYDDQIEFALVVEGWTQNTRREFLTGFYRWRNEILSQSGGGTRQTDDGSRRGLELEDVKSEGDDEL